METGITIKAKSSSGSPYDVVFEHDGEQKKFKVFCNCQAGIHGNLCKHKTQLLDGEKEMLFDLSDKSMLDQVREWVQRSEDIEGRPALNIQPIPHIVLATLSGLPLTNLNRDVESGDDRPNCIFPAHL